jgi:hypothetical protein
MFNKLQQKWKVSGWQMLLILSTFAFGGTLTGYVGRRCMSLIGENDGWFFLPIYIIVMTILWPMMVLLVSIPLGQFNFFKKYLLRIAKKIGLKSGGNKDLETKE